MKKFWDPVKIRERIAEALPEGRVVPRHNEEGHFYEVIDGKFSVPPIYPSVTGKLQILKDESLINYKMNKAVQYVFANYQKFNDANIMDELAKAKRVSQDILIGAGDIGTRIHGYREKIFTDWIRTGEKPEDFLSYIPAEESDIRSTSGLRALRKFVDECDYIPVACEILVYNHKFKVAGTLDDLGLMRKNLKDGNVPDCTHKAIGLEGKMAPTVIINSETGVHTCVNCNATYRYEFVLLDLKTSNAFKDHYFFQVAMYWWALKELLGKEGTPERCFILKVSKEDGTYKIEDLKKPGKLAQYAKHMLKTNEAVEFIKGLRKDNQKTVISI